MTLMVTHRHVCPCKIEWLCTKPECDIPGVTDCTRCAQRRMEDWGTSSGYIRQENARATLVSALRQMRED